MISKDKIAIVIVCTNEKHHLDDCLNSLKKQTYKDFDVWLIDNGSTDGSVDYAKKIFPAINVFENGKNVGFARANNIGMKKVFSLGYIFCVLLNPDTKSDPNFLSALRSTYLIEIKKGNKVGMVQPLLLLYDKPQLINSCGNPLHYLGYGYAGGYQENMKMITNDKEILSVTGGAVLLTKNFFEDVDGFDESFFMYCEDQNMSWQGILLGYKYYLSSKSYLWHKYKFNKGKRKFFYSERNRLMMIFENYSSKCLFILIPIFLVNEILMLIYSLVNGWILLKVKSYFSFLERLPVVLNRRKVVQNSRKIDDKNVIKRMSWKLEFSPITGKSFDFVNYIYGIYYRFILALI